jgi:hypothetical protein
MSSLRRSAERPGHESRGWLAGVRAATVLVFEHPATWALGLAGFLARGGILLLLVPIVPLPSPVGLANIVGPTAATPSGPSPEAAGMLAVGGAVLLAWLVLGNAVGALADVALTRTFVVGSRGASLSTGVPGPGLLGPALLGRLVAVRLAALVPLALALAFAAGPIIVATYGQLISPYDLAVPLVSRVMREVWPLIALIVGAWLLGEIVAGLAVRYIVLRNDSGVIAIGHALGHVVRRPGTTLATTVVGLAGLILAIGPPMVAAAAVWSLLEASFVPSLGQGGDAGRIAFLGLCLVTIWTGGLFLSGVASAWRGLLWTAEVARPDAKRRDAYPDVRQGPG